MGQGFCIHDLKWSLYQVHRVYINSTTYWRSYAFIAVLETTQLKHIRNLHWNQASSSHLKLSYMLATILHIESECTVKVLYSSLNPPILIHLTFILYCIWSSVWKARSTLAIVIHILLIDVHVTNMIDDFDKVRKKWNFKKMIYLSCLRNFDDFFQVFIIVNYTKHNSS